MENDKLFSKELRFEMTKKCFRKCVLGLEEKPLSPYEWECFQPCLENQSITAIELHNNFVKFEKMRKEILN